MSRDGFYGPYRATVIQSRDPVRLKRLRVQIPALGTGTVWANACIPAGCKALPKVGQTVWVLFEGGDPDYPVYLGVMPQPADRSAKPDRPNARMKPARRRPARDGSGRRG
jgi:type VI secretion system (T6SS) baseplate-like injector VgrG